MGAWPQPQARVFDITQITVRTGHQHGRVTLRCREPQQPAGTARFVIWMGVHGHQGKRPPGLRYRGHWLPAYHRLDALLRWHLRLIVVDISVVLQQKTGLDAIGQMVCDSAS
jgi:hypothetical protein